MIQMEQKEMMEMENGKKMQLEYAKMMEMEHLERMNIRNARWIEMEDARRMQMENVERMQIAPTKSMEMEDAIMKEMQHQRKQMEFQRWTYIPRQVPSHMSMNTIKLGSTPLKLKKNILIKHFREFGEKYASKGLEVENIYLRRDKKKKFYAYVTFKNVEDVDACFQLDSEDEDEQDCPTKHEIQGILVPIKRAPKKPLSLSKSKCHP